MVAALLVGAAMLGQSHSGRLSDDDPNSPVYKLKNEIHRLTAEEARMRFGAIEPLSTPPPRQSKVDHFVVLYMENHAADNFFGCMDLPGFDGIKGHTIPKDPTDPSKGTFEVTCGKADCERACLQPAPLLPSHGRSMHREGRR